MKDVPTTVIEIEKAVQVAPDAARQMLDKAAETTKSEG